MQKNYKTFINCVVWVSIILFLVVHFVIRPYDEGSTWDKETLAGDIGYCVTGVSILAWLFNHCLWKIPFIGKCFHTPNLNGVWKGSGKGHSDKNSEPFNMTLKISQTFLETHINAYFDKSQSDSFSSGFIHNATTGRICLVYSYQNDPKLEFRSKAEKGDEGGLSIHYGTTRLEIDFENLKHLSGTYWNDRECVGTIDLTKEQ